MRIAAFIQRAATQRALDHYPSTPARIWYLVVTLAIAVTLYSHARVAVSVLPLLQSDLGFTQQQFGFFFALVFLLGAVSSLYGSLTDRLGRANLLLYGAILAALLTMAVALVRNMWSFFMMGWILTLVEGGLQVTMLALVRDFSPRLSRASAIGFFTIGPWGGQILAATVARLTLPVFGTWQSQYVISGLLSLGVALMSFFLLRELGPNLRNQVVMTGADATQLAERTPQFDAHATTRQPWRQMLRASILLSALGYSLYSVPRYTFTLFLPAYLNTQLAIPLAQANGLTSFFAQAFIGAALLVGICSDRLQTRKPFMFVGSMAVVVGLLIFMTLTPATSMGMLTTTLIGLSLALAMVNISWLAAFTESAEEINPALIGTALAIQGAITRFASIGTAASQAVVVGDGQGWATWWWICVACLLLWLPSIWVLTGNWVPARPSAITAD